MTVRYIDSPTFAQQGTPETVAAALQRLGFKVDIKVLNTADSLARKGAGDFDMYHDVRSASYDDPMDRGGMSSVVTGQKENFGRWSNPIFDRLAEEQDRTLDVVKRKELVLQLQNIFLDDAFAIPMLYRDNVSGALPYVKNYPRYRFTFSPFYRIEQVWLDR